MRDDQFARVLAGLAVLAVAVIAAIVSYSHIDALALSHGYSTDTARLLPLSVDGLILASSLVLLVGSAGAAPGPQACTLRPVDGHLRDARGERIARRGLRPCWRGHERMARRGVHLGQRDLDGHVPASPVYPAGTRADLDSSGRRARHSNYPRPRAGDRGSGRRARLHPAERV